MSLKHVVADADHVPTLDADDLRDGVPSECRTCGLAAHTDQNSGKLRHGFDELQPGDEHDTIPPRGLFTDEQIAPGSDD